jgi:hypothetical protein
MADILIIAAGTLFILFVFALMVGEIIYEPKTRWWHVVLDFLAGFPL